MTYFLYCLKCRALPNLIKFGYTGTTPSNRANQISVADGNIWYVAWFERYQDKALALLLEKRVDYLFKVMGKHAPRACNSEFYRSSSTETREFLYQEHSDYVQLPWARENTYVDAEQRHQAYIRLTYRTPNYWLPLWDWQHHRYNQLILEKQLNSCSE